MKTWFCKTTLAAAAACLTLAAASAAHAAACSNASLTGKYGQTISGEFLPGPPGVVVPQNGVAMTDFDGNGKFTQKDFVVIGGTPTTSDFADETGTYKINADCTGTATINYPDGGWIDLELVVVNRGQEFYTVVSALSMVGGPVPTNIGSHGRRADN
ncbi:MAG TPA: hypothetical protein VJX47_05415 [Candidatus Sulfotelmatobacter sp.]|nr:hypothetical protein [Candidatus Sulfotelmatobacter sp.]